LGLCNQALAPLLRVQRDNRAEQLIGNQADRSGSAMTTRCLQQHERRGR
jgi:hypothetical protein